MLPTLPYTHGTQKIPQRQFGGLDMRAGAPGGSIKFMQNMTSNYAPLAASREPRYTVYTATGNITAQGICEADGYIFNINSGMLYKDGTRRNTLLPSGSAGGQRIFGKMGNNRLLIWPDKILIHTDKGPNETGFLEYLESGITATNLHFENGTYAGESAEANTIRHNDNSFDWSTLFKVGDAVTISGTPSGKNDKTAVVREISGKYLRFYENTFTISGISEEYLNAVTVKREVPDLDYICVNENRVWGCRGDEIRASKLGDPTNWNVFDGLSTDSYSVRSGTGGDFTACVSYMGYPIFFKQEHIFKIYGSKPTNFELMGSATLGVLPGAFRSLAVAGETLYYLSRAGFVAYSGGQPNKIDAALGDLKVTEAASGSDGIKYYASCVTASGDRHLLVFDTSKGMWHREDGLNVNCFACRSGLYAQNGIYMVLLGDPLTVPTGATAETLVSSSVTFADVDTVKIGKKAYTFASKYPVRLWIRAEAASGVVMRVYISHDGGDYVLAATWIPGAKKSGYFPVPIKRCDHYSVKIEATGAWKLYAMETELYAGTESRKG